MFLALAFLSSALAFWRASLLFVSWVRDEKMNVWVEWELSLKNTSWRREKGEERREKREERREKFNWRVVEWWSGGSVESKIGRTCVSVSTSSCFKPAALASACSCACYNNVHEGMGVREEHSEWAEGH
jgi:hypothetical protein